MEESKKNKIWMIISIVAIIVIIVLAVMLINNNNKGSDGKLDKTGSKAKKENVKIVENEASKLTLEEYTSDTFSMKKPKGWTVETGGTGIFYTIRVYDPQNTNNQVYLMLKIQPLLKSESAKSTWQNYSQLSGNSTQYKVFADAVVLSNPTVENFYSSFNQISSYLNSVEPTLSTFKFPTFSNFTEIEESDSNASMKSVALDSKVLRATFTNENSKSGEGLFMASIVNFGSQYQGTVDMSYYMIYDIMSITTSKDQFINYKDTLLNSINSIEFTDSYVKQTIDDGNAQTKNALELNAQMQKAYDSYFEAWENRQKTYDIMSQKQSDATLGYERVYDTDTGDIYKAYNGFTDDYQGNRYKSITDDMYTEKTSGYIEKY